MTKNKIPFLITIDTEGDNLWGKPSIITTKNTMQLYRFQELCEKYGFKPTYLTNYEMAMDNEFVNFSKKKSFNKQCEIGMHLHAWNSPPIIPLTNDDYYNQPYLIDYNSDLMEEKIVFMTHLLEDRFEQKVTSHRAGRWAMNEIYMNLLEKYQYTVDCSVTPGVSWGKAPGGNPLNGGSDYRNYPNFHYHPNYKDISQKGNMQILEVPVTILKKPRCGIKALDEISRTILGTNNIIRKICTYDSWVRPRNDNYEDVQDTVQKCITDTAPYIEFMIHSSELSSGNNPTFSTHESIEKLYFGLEQLFIKMSPYVIGKTMREFYENERQKSL